MGCNLNEFSQCTSKCDCGNLNTLMFKGSGKNELESDHSNKLKKLKALGLIIGTDEAGRGCLAGPVIAAAVCLTPEQEEYLNSWQI